MFEKHTLNCKYHRTFSGVAVLIIISGSIHLSWFGIGYCSKWSVKVYIPVKRLLESVVTDMITYSCSVESKYTHIEKLKVRELMYPWDENLQVLSANETCPEKNVFHSWRLHTYSDTSYTRSPPHSHQKNGANSLLASPIIGQWSVFHTVNRHAHAGRPSRMCKYICY